MSALRSLIRYRELLYMITWRDIRIKYKQSIMGIMWAVLMPMIIVLSGVMVKYAFSVVSGKPFTINEILDVSVRAVPWAFFVASIRFATNSLLGNTYLVTKIYFPREVFPFAAVLSQFFDFLIASGTLVIILTIAKVGFSRYLLFLPYLIACLLLFTTGLGMLLSMANLFFRDVKYLVDVVLTFAIFFTPVLFSANIFGKWSKYVMLNPMSPILEGINICIVYHRMPPLEWIGYSGIFSLILFLVSYVGFKKLEPKFAESI